jgi:hypothetical protein
MNYNNGTQHQTQSTIKTIEAEAGKSVEVDQIILTMK